MKFSKLFIISVLATFFHFNSVSAECIFGPMLGDDISKVEEKYGPADEISDKESIVSTLIDDICPGNNFGNSIFEMQFVGGQLVSFSIIVSNGQDNAESKKMLLYNYVEKNYGKFNSSKNPADWTGFKVWRENDDIIVYKKMYYLKTVLEEELFITNKQYKGLIGTLEDEVIDEEAEADG